MSGAREPDRSAVGLILAAGGGERLHGEAKAFLAWRGEPLIVHAARTLAATCAALRIGIRAEDRERAVEALEKSPPGVPYALVTGGPTRRDTLRNLVEGASHGWIVLHDVARPFASAELAAGVLAAALEHGAASAAARPKERDGVAEHADGFIERVLPHARLAYLQTPQACRTGDLREALDDPALAGEHSVCGLLRARGHAVKLVRGEGGNVKITYPEDLQLLRWRVT